MTHQVCRTCGVRKSLTGFHKRADVPNGHKSQCKECYSEYYKEYSKKRKIVAKEKRCSACGLVKPIECYHKDKYQRDGRKAQCRICFNKQKQKKYSHDTALRKTHMNNARARRNNADHICFHGKSCWAEGLIATSLYDQKCVIAGCNNIFITAVHIFPLALGGLNCRYNQQPMCQYHNDSKGSKLQSEWLKQNGLTLRR